MPLLRVISTHISVAYEGTLFDQQLRSNSSAG